MALESFYGGKPGLSPVIRNSFKFINKDDQAYKDKKSQTFNMGDLSPKEQAILETLTNETVNITWTDTLLKPFTMDECFKDPEYKDVWYNELCIIDTESKSNPNNGKLFRRTLKRIESALDNGGASYAEYIGQIVGPSGGIPNLQLGSVESVRQQAAGIIPTLETDSNNMITTNWDFFYPFIDDNEKIVGSSAPPLVESEDESEDNFNRIAELSVSQNNTINMVPGYIPSEPGSEENPTYNDEIKYTWCNVHRKSETEEKSFWLYLGFDIPYTVFDIVPIEENFTYSDEIIKDISLESHPFFKQYEFHIPRGTRGLGLEEIFIGTKIKDENNQNSWIIKKYKTEEVLSVLYPKDAIKYSNEGINTEGNIIPRDCYYVEPLEQKDSVIPNEDTFWVGKWTLYNPKQENPLSVYTYIGPYKEIKDVEYDSNSGLINFTYTNLESTEIGPIHQLGHVEIENGELHLYYTDNVNNSSIDPNTGERIWTWRDSENIGLVIHNPSIVSTIPVPDSNNNVNNVNTTNDLITYLNTNHSSSYIYTDQGYSTKLTDEGQITTGTAGNEKEQTGNFICVKETKGEGQSQSEEFYIIYYDPAQGSWINGGLLNGRGKSQDLSFNIKQVNNSMILSDTSTNIDFVFYETTLETATESIPLSDIAWL